MLPHVVIYTDGACLGNPGPGGWAALIRTDGGERALQGREAHSTNNRMELMAALEALQALGQPSQVEFYTDSQYLRRGVTEWLSGWQARGWKRKGGKLANIELWQALAKAILRHEIHWHWVKGHSASRDNQRVDRLANEAMRGTSAR
jgi:ribonuclease HI